APVPRKIGPTPPKIARPAAKIAIPSSSLGVTLDRGREHMRVALADLRSERGFVNKDTAVGGYGQRMTAFCTIARLGVFARRPAPALPDGDARLPRGAPRPPGPRGRVPPLRDARRRRRARAVVPRRPPPGDRVGRPRAGPRHARRLRGDHRLQAPAPLRLRR